MKFMSLASKFFKGDGKLEACLVNDAAHVVQGTTGDHVRKIQTALFVLDGLKIKNAEIDGKFYGQSTAAAVLSYKQKRGIINYSYQTQADNMVGKMTIASLDKEMFQHELLGADRNCCASLGKTTFIFRHRR
jgi:hypothetical protein